MYFNIIFVSWFFILIIDTCAWSFSNLLMAGSQATLTFADTVAIGAQKGLEECARQFTFERWPCPQDIFTNVFQNHLPVNREIAFVQAIVSAGIVHTVTRNCSLGHLDNCSCASSARKNRSPTSSTKNNFRWGGCSDNTELGSRIAIAYIDKREVGHDFRTFISLHNNEVGRHAVQMTMLRICKCHGVSGSCSLKTCWKKINEFQVVGNYLKKAYRKAIKIESSNKSPVGPNDVLVKSTLAIPKRKLGYSEDSPDYCIANTTLGSNGTLGRHCSRRKGKNVTKEERQSCRKLCKQCGLRVKKERRKIITSCNCKFKFCCQVQCQSCTKEVFTFVCIKS